MGHVRIQVQACGICHSDVFTKDGLWPGIQYPRVPGHEIAGVIDAIGSDVGEWGNRANESVWDGTEDIVDVANLAAEVILSSAAMHSCRE